MGTKIIVSSVVNSLRIKGEFSVLENSFPSVPSLFYIDKSQTQENSIQFAITTFSPKFSNMRKKLEMNVEGGK